MAEIADKDTNTSPSTTTVDVGYSEVAPLDRKPKKFYSWRSYYTWTATAGSHPPHGNRHHTTHWIPSHIYRNTPPHRLTIRPCPSTLLPAGENFTHP